MDWIIELAIIMAISSVVFGVILIVEVRRRLKQTDVEVKTRVRLREVQIHPSSRGTPPESKQLRWFRCIAYPFAAPFILVMFVCMLAWVLLHKHEPIDVEAETRRHKEELEAFVSTARARMIEARKARVFEEVLLRDVVAARAERRAKREEATFAQGFKSWRMYRKERAFYSSTLHNPR